MKPQTKTKNGGIGESLITLNKIIRNQGSCLFCCNYEQSSQNNQCTWCSPLKYGSIIPKKKASHERTKSFMGKKKYGEVVLNGRTNGQIMPRFGRSFI